MFLLTGSTDFIISVEFLRDILLAQENNLFHKLLMLIKIKKRSHVVWYLAKSTSLFQNPPSLGEGLVLPEESIPQLPIHVHVYLTFSSPPPLSFPEKSWPRPALVRTPHLQILPILYLQTLENYTVNKHWVLFTTVSCSLSLTLNSIIPVRIPLVFIEP